MSHDWSKPLDVPTGTTRTITDVYEAALVSKKHGAGQIDFRDAVYDARGPYAKLSPMALYLQACNDLGDQHPAAIQFGIAAGKLSPKARLRPRRKLPRFTNSQQQLF